MKYYSFLNSSSLGLAFIICYFLLFSGPNIMSQSSPKGKWFQANEAVETINWQAQWIWIEEALQEDMLLARRTFTLEEVPAQSQLLITASSQYQLYINGQYICRGPARSAPHHQSFDILDINNYLQKGDNCIAIRVHHQKNKHSYHFKGRAGLLAQIELNSAEKKRTIPTDENWKVNADPSWNSNAPVISRFQMVVNDRVDLQKQLERWNTLEFDDYSWADATPLMRKVGWPTPQKNASPQALTPPWTTLVARDVPYLLEQKERAVKLVEARIMDAKLLNQPIPRTAKLDSNISLGLEGYQKSESPLIIPVCEGNDGYFLLFDFGQIRNGYPQLVVEGTAGTKVDILSAPFVIDHQFSHRIIDSDFNDKITLSGKKDQWEATYFKPTRYLGLFIQNHKQPVKLYTAGIRYIEYPFEEKGFIHSTDAAWINRYMTATSKTIQVCTTDGYTDNYRERRQYAQTGYYGALGNYWLFGDYTLQRRYLIQVAQEQEANGIMPAYAPLASDDYMVILDSNCLWIRSLRNYLLYSGDEKTVRDLLPTANRLLDLLHSFTNDLGLIDNPPYAYWLDHSLIDRRGANFCLNGHYLGALEDYAEVLDWLNEANSEVFRKRADLLRQSLRDHLWDEQKGLFADALIDRKRSTQFSEHANAMALAEKVATIEQAQKMIPQILEKDELNYIKRTSGMTMVTLAMSYFLHKGLCEYGQIDASFELFRRRFDKMLDPEYNGTLWEEWWLGGTGRSGKLQKKTRSDAQTESAFPPALFGTYLLGIQAITPGWKKVTLRATASTPKHLEANIPTPEGILKIEWRKNVGAVNLEIPGAMEVHLDLQSFEALGTGKIYIDGNVTNLSNTLILTKGVHSIRF